MSKLRLGRCNNMEMVDTLEYHKENPNISVESYIREKRIKLAHKIHATKKIYLDTNFWILFRDVRLERTVDKNAIELLSILEKLVATGKVICPISNDTFSEIFKQTDLKTLRACTQLIDDLSKDVVLISMKERIDFEIIHFIRDKSQGIDCVYTPNEMVWTKMAYVLGFCTPTSKLYPPELGCAIQKAFIDQLWVTTMVDMLNQMGPDIIYQTPEIRDISEELNKGKFEHIHECNSFKKLFLAELGGILEMHKPDFQDLMRYLYESGTGQSLSEDEKASDDSGRLVANLIYHAFRLNRIKSELPSFRINAGIHAAIRWDKKRKYKPTDLHDFHHVAAALPYCDYFLTERSLRNLVHNRNLRFREFFNCKTISDINVALNEFLKIS